MVACLGLLSVLPCVGAEGGQSSAGVSVEASRFM